MDTNGSDQWRVGRKGRHRKAGALNNVVEQDPSRNQVSVRAMQIPVGRCAWRTIQGIEAINILRKGQIKWLAKDDM
ncbi:MAG: hypothetical protein ACJ746_29025 [Bryobacteraceae bacterium]